MADWVDKNADKLPPDVYRALENSADNLFLQPTYAALNPENAEAKDGKRGRAKGKSA